MKFLHTADWQIGMKFNHVGAVAEICREQRLETVRRLVSIAKENAVEFVLVAGDVFEDNGVERPLIIKTADLIASFGCPTYIIPGNHDPFVPGSVWSHFSWRELPNVHVLVEEKPIEVPGGWLYPCPVLDKYSAKDPTAWIPLEASGGMRIGMAHGNVEGLPQGEPDHPILRTAPERLKLDYLALGHWHSTGTYPDSTGIVRMAYCGTPESSGFGERDSGNVLVVEIESPGAPPKIQSVKSGQLCWQTVAQEIRLEGEIHAVRKEIEDIPEPKTRLLDLELSGTLHASDIQELRNLEDIIHSRFLYSKMDSSRLRLAPEDSRWIDNLPAGFIREAASRLRDMASTDREESAAAARALLELYVLAEEARR